MERSDDAAGRGFQNNFGLEEGSKMKRLENDVPDSFQTLASGITGEDSRQLVHLRPTGLPIRVREMYCALADIQAEIQMLRRERTYLRLVRGELAARKPRKRVFPLAPPR